MLQYRHKCVYSGSVTEFVGHTGAVQQYDRSIFVWMFVTRASRSRYLIALGSTRITYRYGIRTRGSSVPSRPGGGGGQPPPRNAMRETLPPGHASMCSEWYLTVQKEGTGGYCWTCSLIDFISRNKSKDAFHLMRARVCADRSGVDTTYEVSKAHHNFRRCVAYLSDSVPLRW